MDLGWPIVSQLITQCNTNDDAVAAKTRRRIGAVEFRFIAQARAAAFSSDAAPGMQPVAAVSVRGDFSTEADREFAEQHAALEGPFPRFSAGRPAP